MKTILSYGFLILLFTSLCLQTQAKTFTFPTTQFSYMAKDAAVPPQSKSSVIEVSILEDGTLCIVGEGEYKLAEINGGNWQLNSMGALEIRRGDEFFLIHRQKGIINIGKDGSVMMFTNPANILKFKGEYDAMFIYLQGLHKIKRERPDKSTSQQQGSGKIATSGELSPMVFAYHPFGVVPTNCTTMQSIINELNNVEFPNYIYPEELLNYGSQKRILYPPFTVFGKKVTDMDAYFHDGRNLTNYSLDIFDYKKNWTQNNVIELCKKIVDNLTSNGFKETGDTLFKTSEFFYADLKNGNRHVIVTATTSSRTSTYDSYKISISIRL